MSNNMDNLTPNMTDMDLPLMANANEIRVRHYMIHLELPKEAWEENLFHGQIILFLDPFVKERDAESMKQKKMPSSSPESDFEFVLDCHDLMFKSVYKINLPTSYKKRIYADNPTQLTFEERKDAEVMQGFFR